MRSKPSSDVMKNAAKEKSRIQQLENLYKFAMLLSGEPAVVFRHAVRMVAELFDVPVVRLMEVVGTTVVFRARCVHDKDALDAGSCPLDITPAAHVVKTKDVWVCDRVAERFSQASFLREHKAQAYCGIPAMDSSGQVIAVICLLDHKPRDFTVEDQHLLRVIGQRIAAELERSKISAARARAEDQLRRSEARLREAQKIAQIGSWELDLVEGTLVWTDEVFTIFEIDKETFGASYEAFLATIHPDDRNHVDAVYRRSVKEATPYEVTHRLLFADGRIKHVRERGISFYAEDGRPLRSVGTVQDITERTLAELALRQSEERYNLAVEAARDGIWEWNAATGDAYFSPRAKEIAGYVGEEFPDGDSAFFDLIHPDDTPAVENALHRHFPANAPFSREFRLRHKDGTYGWVFSRGSSRLDAQGRAVRMIGTMTDISERKRVEAALRESEARLQLVFDSTSDMQMLYRVEPDGRFILEMANRVARENVAAAAGRNSLEVVGRELEEIFKAVGLPAEQIEFRRSMYQKAARERTLVRYATDPLNNLREALEVSIVPVLNPAGECTHVLWTGRVVTEQYKAITELREREERLRVIFNAHRDLQSVIRIEPDCRFVSESFNQAHLDYAREFIPDPIQYLEREREELLRAVGIPENEIAKAAAQWREVAATRTSASYELSWTIGAAARRETGKIAITPLVDGNGTCTRLLWTAHLVTAQKQMEARIADERDRLRQILDSQFGSVAVLSPDGIIVEVNQGPVARMGLQRADVVGRPFWEVGWFKPGTKPQVEGYVRRAARGEVVRADVSARFSLTDDRPRYMDGVFSPLRDAQGEVTGVVAFGVDITERKLAEIKRMESEARLSLVFNSTSDFQALFRVEPGGRFVVEALNRSLIEALRDWIPAPLPDMMGQDVAEFLSAAGVSREKMALRLKTFQEVAEQRTPTHVAGVASGLPEDVSIYPIVDGERRCTHLLVVARSIRDRQRAEQMQASLREKETLLREVHHRVKNNLQIISTLLRFESKKIVDPRDGEVFRQGQDRLRAMILVHEHLYRSPTLSEIDFGDYTRSLAEQFAAAQGEARDRIHLTVESPKITVPAELALPAGMIITELLSNAFKHAFPGQQTGSVTVRVTQAKNAFAVSVEDDGIGIKPETSLGNPDGFGLKMVRGLSQQLRAELSYQTDAGTKIRLEVPYVAH